MNYFLITFENGKTDKVAMNCTLKEATTYYIGNYFPPTLYAKPVKVVRVDLLAEGETCGACGGRDVAICGAYNGVQGDGQEVGVTTYECKSCGSCWTD